MISPLLNFFDTHAHLKDDEPDPEAFCRKAKNAGVSRILLLGSGMQQCRTLAELSETVPGVYFAAGIHPHDAAALQEDPASFIREFQAYPRLAAIGEIGLDFFYDFSDEQTQLRLFAGFLDLALSLNLPASIHIRDKADCDHAYALAYDLIAPFCRKGGRCVLHAFAGTVPWAKKFLELGNVWFGVGGMLTFKKADNVRETVRTYPLDRIFLETDSPYLAPVPYRGQENHPMYVPVIGAALAALRGITPDEIARITTENAMRFFCPKELI